jgi:hypothetical protein
MLKPILDSVDTIDEGLREHYREVDGKFVLDVEPQAGWALENVGGLKSALSEERENRKRLAAQLDAFKVNGDLPSPDDVRSLREKLAALQDATPKDQVEQVVAQRVADVKSKYDKQLKDTGTVTEGLKNKLHKVVVEGAAVAAIARAGASESLKMLLPNVMAQLGIDGVEGDDLPRVFVRGANGAPRITTGAGTDPMTVDELLAEMKESADYARAFPGAGGTGSGAAQPGHQRSGAFRLTTAQMRDHKLYERVKAEAKAAGQQIQFVD